jgi:hypothetical protein
MENAAGKFAEEAVGVTPPRSFILDASVLDMAETHRIVAEDIKQNRIAFKFPEGMNKLDLFEECRILARLDDFDAMYDYAMRKLEGKPVGIFIKNYDGSVSELCSFQVTDIYQNLHGIDAIDEYPIIVTWLTGFLGADLLKKYPIPGNSQLPQPQESEKTAARKEDREKEAAPS